MNAGFPTASALARAASKSVVRGRAPTAQGNRDMYDGRARPSADHGATKRRVVTRREGAHAGARVITYARASAR